MPALKDYELWRMTDLHPNFKSEQKRVEVIREGYDDPFALALYATNLAKKISPIRQSTVNFTSLVGIREYVS